MKQKEKDELPQYDLLLAEVLEKQCDLFKGTDGALYMHLDTPNGKTTYPLRSMEGMARVTALFTDAEGHIYNSSEQERAARLAYGRILDKPTRDVFTRVGKMGRDYYLDLHSQPKKYVKFNADGWLLTDSVPIHFQEGQGQMPMPEPLGVSDYQFGFTALRNLLTVDEQQWRCLLPLLVNYLLPDKQQPIAVLTGEQKSGKSTFVEIIKTLVDPNTAMLGGDVPDTRDLFIKVSSAWVATFDNLSSLNEKQLDAICTLATGGTFQTRRLFTDTDMVTLTCRNPVLLAGISNVARRGDVADRAVLFELKSMDEQAKPLTMEAIRERLHECAPSILRALLYLTCYVLKVWDTIEVPSKVRPASFGIIGRAVEQAMGWPKGSFELAYHSTRKPLEADVLEGYAVMSALLELLAGKREIGEYSQHPDALLAELVGGHATDEQRKAFPKTAATFSKVLTDCAPALRKQYGWHSESKRDWKGRFWRFTYNPPVEPTAPVPAPAKPTPPEVATVAARLMQPRESLAQTVRRHRTMQPKKGEPTK